MAGVSRKTAGEIEIAEMDRERALALSAAWIKELWERAKAQWEQLVGVQ